MQPHYNTNFAMSIPLGNFFLIGILEMNLKVDPLRKALQRGLGDVVPDAGAAFFDRHFS